MKITIEKVMSWRPCIGLKAVEYYAAGRTEVEFVELLRDESIPIHHRIWLGLQEGPHVRPVTECIVERAIRRSLGKSGYPGWGVWAKNWLNGTNRSKAAAAEAAIEVAAWERMARGEAGVASVAAAVAAAEMVATEVAEQAAYVAWKLGNPASETARVQEREQQLADILNLVN